MNYREFENQQALLEWLSTSAIDVFAWGVGGAKTLDALWMEYVTGETRFTDDPPARVVEVAQVIIRRGEAMLVELSQEFGDGRRRVRLRPPSEKLKTGEDPRSAALRCMREELGLAPLDIAIENERVPIEDVADSPSYPGLPTRYRFHTFEVTAGNLPDEDFALENDAPDDPVRRHLWGWRLPNDHADFKEHSSGL